MAQSREMLARLSLDGLSVGDGFGEKFFCSSDEILRMIQTRTPPEGPWRWTDDTEMALSICEALGAEPLDQDRLAQAFAARHDPTRGYGEMAHEILSGIREGGDWRRLSTHAFQGQGSFGNGAAMRVAPVGAYLHADLETAVETARRSAEVTHAHEEGIAGAIAVAIGAALAVGHAREPLTRDGFLRGVIERIPPGYTREGIEKALELDADVGIVAAALELGNGSGVTAPDTVPLCMFVAARNLDSFEDALWDMVSALGDRDTTCAIVGGIVSLSSRQIPEGWLQCREPLGL